MSKPVPMKLMPIIAVESVDEIRSFYVETLGFDHVMGVVGKDGQFDFVTVVKDGARIMFARGADAAGKKFIGAKQPVEIYLEVSDVGAYHEQLKKKRVKITDPLTMQWWEIKPSRSWIHMVMRSGSTRRPANPSRRKE